MAVAGTRWIHKIYSQTNTITVVNFVGSMLKQHKRTQCLIRRSHGDTSSPLRTRARSTGQQRRAYGGRISSCCARSA
uniref:Uncharacterized protein n=1 Tax=Triticum urartu TaxID=4572 RepID=A0A8R7PP62_TRIUA